MLRSKVDQRSTRASLVLAAAMLLGSAALAGAQQTQLRGYFERLLARPSIQRVLAEARPFFSMFPYRDEMPKRFLA